MFLNWSKQNWLKRCETPCVSTSTASRLTNDWVDSNANYYYTFLKSQVSRTCRITKVRSDDRTPVTLFKVYSLNRNANYSLKPRIVVLSYNANHHWLMYYINTFYKSTFSSDIQKRFFFFEKSLEINRSIKLSLKKFLFNFTNLSQLYLSLIYY